MPVRDLGDYDAGGLVIQQSTPGWLTTVVDPPLPPVVHPNVARLVGEAASELRRLAGEGGTPFHVFFPGVMLATIDRFRRVMDDAGDPDGRIYFAVKATDANSPLAVAAACAKGQDSDTVDRRKVRRFGHGHDREEGRPLKNRSDTSASASGRREFIEDVKRGFRCQPCGRGWMDRGLSRL